MEKGGAAAEKGRAALGKALDGAERAPVLGSLLSTPQGKAVAGALRGKQGKKLEHVPTPFNIKDAFGGDGPPAQEASAPAGKASVASGPSGSPGPTEAPLGDPSVGVQIYGRRTCMWSGRALRLAQDRDFDHRFVDLDEPGKEHLETSLVRETKQTTTPYVFVRGAFVGDYKALDELDRVGQLELLLLSDDERREREARTGIRLEVPKRDA